jgi:glycerol uptake facilitator protein
VLATVERFGLILLGDFVGMFILIFIGDGAVITSTVFKGYDLFGVAIVWFIAVTLAIYAAGAISGAHFNPAITMSFAAFYDFRWRLVPAFIITQIAGAFAAAAVLYALFSGTIKHFEAMHHIVRGHPGSQMSAFMFTTFSPNPGLLGVGKVYFAQVSHVQWFAAEAVSTLLLIFCILFLIDQRNEARPNPSFVPVIIGLLVGGLVAIEAPLTMTALNPARDLGPRLFTLVAGWGGIAFPAPRHGWWIPSVATVFGGLVGAALYRYGYSRAFIVAAPPGREPAEIQEASEADAAPGMEG